MLTALNLTANSSWSDLGNDINQDLTAQLREQAEYGTRCEVSNQIWDIIGIRVGTLVRNHQKNALRELE